MPTEHNMATVLTHNL